MNPTRKHRRLFLSLTIFLAIPLHAGAAWTEAGHSILTLDEALGRLHSETGIAGRSALPGDTPVIFPGDPSQLGPKAIQVALVQSGMALRDDGEIVRPHALSERMRAERRRIPHFISTPRGQDAIDSGGLVLFGTVHEPPFTVEVSMGEVLINGVSVYPSPGEAAAPPTPSDRQRANHESLEAGVADFASSSRQGDEHGARQRLAASMLERPEILSAEWTGDSDLTLTHRDGSIELITISDEGRDADASASSEDEALRGLADGLRRNLEDNFTVLAGASYLLTVNHANAHSFRRRVEEIRNSGESELMKLARLQAWTGQRNAAADLLFNQ